jgi:hypothetical protein
VILTLLVPTIAEKVVDYFILEQGSIEEMAAQQVISMSSLNVHGMESNSEEESNGFNSRQEPDNSSSLLLEDQALPTVSRRQ